MSCRITDSEPAVIYDDTTNKPISPMIIGGKEAAEKFIEWLDVDDPRELDKKKLAKKYYSFKRLYEVGMA